MCRQGGDIGGYYKADSEKCKAVMRPEPHAQRFRTACRLPEVTSARLTPGERQPDKKWLWKGWPFCPSTGYADLHPFDHRIAKRRTGDLCGTVHQAREIVGHDLVADGCLHSLIIRSAASPQPRWRSIISAESDDGS